MLANDAATQTERKPKKKPVEEPPAVILNLDQSIITNEKTIVRSCDFEVFGIVQDVSFRHYTLRRAQKLGIRGWCMSTENGTIKGTIQGYPRSFQAMRLWLKYTGSPTSRIDKCVFGQTEELREFTFDDFTIRGR